jgi:hypothetical protein
MTKVEFALAEAQDSEDVVIICFSKEGDMTIKSTITSGPEILWAVELMKSHILEMGTPLDG